MEIKATLQKPYTEEQRTSFIINQNHRLGYEIRETETELQAWGLTNAEKEEIEKERISHLKCTKRVLVLMLQELQYSWKDVIKPLIYANDDAALEWELCVELERKNPLLDQVGNELGIEPEQIDNLFKCANGEITKEEFLGGD